MIIHISTVHPRSDTRIFLKQLISLSKKFSDVNLLVADGLGNEEVKNIKIIDFGKPLNRFERIAYKPFKIFNFLKNKNIEVIQIHDPELLPLALFLTWKGRKVIYDAHEDYRLDLLSREWIPRIFRRISAKLVGLIEDYIVSKISGTICATDSIEKRLKNKSQISTVINNFPIIDEFSDIHKSEHMGARGKLRVCYVGAIAEERGLRPIVKALLDFHGDVMLELGGTFTDRAFEDSLKNENGWQYVNYYGQISRKEMNEVFLKSDIGVITYFPLKSHLESQPNKIFECLSARLPIICSNFDHWKRLFKGYNCAYFVDPKNSESISEGISYFIENKLSINEMGLNARELVETKYSWESEEEKFLSFYKQIIDQ